MSVRRGPDPIHGRSFIPGGVDRRNGDGHRRTRCSPMSVPASHVVPTRYDRFAPLGSDPWLRTLVADRLGVEEAELAPHVSLRDDLAVDSLDLAELAAALESEIGIGIPLSLLERIATYGELLTLAEALVDERVRRA